MVADESLLTVEEVNQRLPLVKSIVGDIVSLHADIAARRQRLSSLRRRHPAPKKADSVYEQEVLQMETELAGDEVRIEEFAQELLGIGGILTNAAEGRVDFHGELGGERVSFCWQPGDQELQAWHSGACGESERLSLDHELGSVTVSEGK